MNFEDKMNDHHSNSHHYQRFYIPNLSNKSVSAKPTSHSSDKSTLTVQSSYISSNPSKSSPSFINHHHCMSVSDAFFQFCRTLSPSSSSSSSMASSDLVGSDPNSKKLNPTANPYHIKTLQTKPSNYIPLSPHEILPLTNGGSQTSTYVKPEIVPHDIVAWPRASGFGTEPTSLYHHQTLNFTCIWLQPNIGFQPAVHWLEMLKPQIEINVDASFHLGVQYVDDMGAIEPDVVNGVNIVTGFHKNGEKSNWGFRSLIPRVSRNKRLVEQRDERPVDKKWVPKVEKYESRNKEISGGDCVSNVITFPSDPQELERSGITTVMIKNIPNQFRRGYLLSILTEHCKAQNDEAAQQSNPGLRSEIDFVYLPMDFLKYWDEKRVANLGYAFVNFTTSEAASRFHDCFHKRKWNVSHNNKTCEITVAKIQGKEAMIKSFENKIFFCHCDEYLPVVYEPACDGWLNSTGQIVGRRFSARPWHPLKKQS